MNKWVHLIAGLILWSFVIFFILNAITTGVRVYTWSSTQGAIISSDLKSCGKGDGLSLATISYSYSINNSTYVGNRIEPYLFSSDCYHSSLHQKDLADKYRANANILVYFNSEQPNNFFILGDSLGVWHYLQLIFTIGIMSFFAFGLVAIFWGEYKKVNSKEE